MFKFDHFLLFTLVICSSILVARGSDDEFAEFDDFAPSVETANDNDFIQLNLKQTPPSEPSKIPAEKSLSEKPAKPAIEIKKKEAKVEVAEDIVLIDDFADNKASEEEAKDKTQSRPDLKLVNAPLPRIYKWESYYIEIAFLLAILLYMVNFFLGSSKNNKIALDWYDQSRNLLKQQFSLVGGAPQLGDKKVRDGEDAEPGSNVKKQKGLIKSTESQYTLWNSGRVGMDGLLIEINLLKRQCLFSMSLILLKPARDTFILRFLLNQDGYENFVFCLSNKSQTPKLARDMVDINTFCSKKKPLSHYGVPVDRLFVMSELSDSVPFILDQTTVGFITKYEQYINYIHITDQYSTNRSDDTLPAQKLANPKRMATFSFDMPKSANDGAEFILFALSLLDRLRRFRLARDSKQKSEKNRQKISDILQKTAFLQRQEAAQAKKEELRRQEKERIYNEDDPEKQMRWEKKEAKRELKKNKMRVKQLKVKSM